MEKDFFEQIDPALIFDSKPNKCPKCNGKVLEILWGEPTYEIMHDPSNKDFIIGGCCMPFPSPKWGCVKCEAEFYKKDE